MNKFEVSYGSKSLVLVQFVMLIETSMRWSNIVCKLSSSNRIEQREMILGLRKYEEAKLIHLILSIIVNRLGIDGVNNGTSGSNMIE